jgi:hypothetical protein
LGLKHLGVELAGVGSLLETAQAQLRGRRGLFLHKNTRFLAILGPEFTARQRGDAHHRARSSKKPAPIPTQAEAAETPSRPLSNSVAPCKARAKRVGWAQAKHQARNRPRVSKKRESLGQVQSAAPAQAPFWPKCFVLAKNFPPRRAAHQPTLMTLNQSPPTGVAFVCAQSARLK